MDTPPPTTSMTQTTPQKAAKGVATVGGYPWDTTPSPLGSRLKGDAPAPAPMDTPPPTTSMTQTTPQKSAKSLDAPAPMPMDTPPPTSSMTQTTPQKAAKGVATVGGYP